MSRNGWVVTLASGMALVVGAAGDAIAGTVTAVPEIGPASISAGLAILAGGVLMLRARRGR